MIRNKNKKAVNIITKRKPEEIEVSEKEIAVHDNVEGVFVDTHDDVSVITELENIETPASDEQSAQKLQQKMNDFFTDATTSNTTENSAEETSHMADGTTNINPDAIPTAEHHDNDEPTTETTEKPKESAPNTQPNASVANMHDVLVGMSTIYGDDSMTDDQKEEAIDELVTSNKKLEDSKTASDEKQIPLDEYIYCIDLLALLEKSVDRTINIIETMLTKEGYNHTAKPKGSDTLGSKVSLINYLIREIGDKPETAKKNIVINERGDYTTIEDIINLIRNAIMLNHIIIKCGLIGNDAINDKLAACINLKTSLNSILTRCKANKDLISGLAIIIVLYRVKVLKYQAIDVIMRACSEIAEFITSHEITTDVDASNAGLSTEFMDELVKCLADINRQI